ncbi:MAG: isochorismatase family protein [Nitrospirales bacterium]
MDNNWGRVSSFREQGGIWPSHCVAETHGAEPPIPFSIPPGTVIVRKGTTPQEKAYSGFEGTTLDGQLKRAGVNRLFVGGLATDYCVFNTVKDALTHSYEVYLLIDAIRAVNVQPTDGKEAEKTMIQQGAHPIQLRDLAAPK